MTNGVSDRKLAKWAIVSLTAISIMGIASGVVVAKTGQHVDAIAPIVTGAVAGIVAIVLQMIRQGGGGQA